MGEMLQPLPAEAAGRGAPPPVMPLEKDRFYFASSGGDTVSLVSGTGSVVWKGDWSCWGSSREASSALPTPFGWGGAGGMQSEGETGLIYAQQRYYSPKLGRFLSRDPLGFSGGLHPYAYCDNDPHNRTDPDGREDEPKNPDHCGTLDAMTSPLMKVLSGIDGAVDALAEAAVNGANALTRPTMVSGTPTLGNAQYGGGKEGEAQRQAAKRAGKALDDAIEGAKKGIAKEALYQALGGAAGHLTEAGAGVVKALAKVYKKFPIEGFKCDKAAIQALKALEAVYPDAHIVEIKHTSRGVNYFASKDGTVFATTGFHRAVVAGGRVYDGLTGAAGATWAEYWKLWHPNYEPLEMIVTRK